MDDIALNFSDLTTPDRAERARKAWEIYSTAHGGEVQDLISDLLHLADVDEIPGGGAYVARRGVENYMAELATWPSETPHATGSYLAQVRHPGGPWTTVGGGDDRRVVADTLRSGMERVGFRFSELSDHVD